MIKKIRFRTIKIIGSVFLCICIAMVLHAITIVPENSDFTGTVIQNYRNIIAEEITFLGAAILFFIVAYTIIAMVYMNFQRNLYGSKINGALTYGFVIGSIWWMGMYEMSALFLGNVVEETWVGFSDLVPIVILILLLSRYVNHNSGQPSSKRRFSLKALFLSVIVFSIMFVLGRYLLSISGFSAIPPKSPTGYFVWTIFMGCVFGVSFYLLEPMTRTKGRAASTCRYAFLVFGSNWAIYVLFMVVIFGFDIVPQCFVRIVMDIITTIISAGIVYKIQKFK